MTREPTLIGLQPIVLTAEDCASIDLDKLQNGSCVFVRFRCSASCTRCRDLQQPKLTAAQWRERARWIRYWGEHRGWDWLHVAAEAWEREHRRTA